MKAAYAAAVLALSAATAQAKDFDIETPDQNAFRSVSKDLVDAYSYKSLGPAEATGLTGFGVGGFASYLSVDDKQAWQTLTGENVSEIGMVGVVAHKGLPFGFDVGAFYGYVPKAEADVFGAEVRYAILEGGVISPALAIRGSYTALTGVDDFDLSTYGLDLTASKGFAFLTPYAGVGHVWGSVDPIDGIPLSKEDVDHTRVFVGLRLSLLLLQITPEYEHVGSNDVFNLRFGLSI